MVNKRYEVGENAPADVYSASTTEDVLTFAMPVEVYHGYGNAKHVYPTEQIERASDLFVTGGEPAEMTVADEIRLYTIPRDTLHWARRHARGSRVTRTVRKLMIDYQAVRTTTYQGDG